MNRKGFTLVELLAVIIILALLAVIASTSVTKVVDDSKSNLQTAQIELIEKAARTWSAENIYNLPKDENCIYLTLKDLKTYGLIDSDIVDPKTEKKLSNDIKIKISAKTSSYDTKKLNYEVDPESVAGCIKYVKPSEPSESPYIDTNSSICELVDGIEGEIGSEYLCQVNPEKKYTFYVLSYNTDGTTNLIMDSNINKSGVAIKSNDITDKGLVTWNESGDNTNGPVTAMNFLYNATKDWSNIPNIVMNYEDENIKYSTEKKGNQYGYGEIITSGNKTIITDLNGNPTLELENVKARLPRYGELVGEGKCLTNYNYGSCPLWLVNYLQNNSYYLTENGKQDKNGISGYWVLSSAAGFSNSNYAWNVYHYGFVDYTSVTSSSRGVRPVITLTLD